MMETGTKAENNEILVRIDKKYKGKRVHFRKILEGVSPVACSDFIYEGTVSHACDTCNLLVKEGDGFKIVNFEDLRIVEK